MPDREMPLVGRQPRLNNSPMVNIGAARVGATAPCVLSGELSAVLPALGRAAVDGDRALNHTTQSPDHRPSQPAPATPERHSRKEPIPSLPPSIEK
jgi:hypothetical protein